MDAAPEQQIRVPQLQLEEPPDPDERPSRRYRQGALIPPGYVLTTTYNSPLLGTGAALLSFHWILSLVLARTDLSLAPDSAVRKEGRNNALMAPLVGPFIALGTDDDRPGAEYALLTLDGVAQLGSLAMIAAGLTLREKWLVPVEVDVAGTGTTVRLRF